MEADSVPPPWMSGLGGPWGARWAHIQERYTPLSILHDMTLPLSAYLISSGHNRYANQCVLGLGLRLSLQS
jgi:hypothetical protein